MFHDRCRRDAIRPPLLGASPGQIDVFVVQEVPLVESTGRLQELGGEQHCATGEQLEIRHERLLR